MDIFDQEIAKIPKGKKFRLTALNSQDEVRFQADVMRSAWYRDFVSRFGGPPNLNGGNYDYRGAWRAGARPSASGNLHWPSQTPEGRRLKAPTHPTAWKEEFLQKTGVDPDQFDRPTAAKFFQQETELRKINQLGRRVLR